MPEHEEADAIAQLREDVSPLQRIRALRWVLRVARAEWEETRRDATLDVILDALREIRETAAELRAEGRR